MYFLSLENVDKVNSRLSPHKEKLFTRYASIVNRQSFIVKIAFYYL